MQVIVPGGYVIASSSMSGLRRYARDLVRISPSYRNPEHIFGEQIKATTRVVRWVAKLSGPTSIALTALFWSASSAPALIAGDLWIMTSCVWAIMLLPSQASSQSSSNLARSHFFYALIHGLGWMMLTTAMLPYADLQQSMFVACLQIGMVAIGFVLYLNLPVAFIAFSIPTASPFIVLFARAEGRTIVAIPLVLILFVILMRIAVDQSRMFAGSVRDREEIHRLAIEGRQAEEAADCRASENRLIDADRRTAAVADVAETRRSEMMALAERFRQDVLSIVDNQVAAVSSLDGSADELAYMIQRTASAADDVSNRTILAATAINNLAAASSNIASSISGINEQLNKHSSLNADVAQMASDSERRIFATSQEARHVHGVAEAISKLAQQTELLALNANIEAARAGAAGRGFAVVAAEVKSLAERASTETRRATLQLDHMVESIGLSASVVEKTVLGVSSVAAIGASIAASVALQREAAINIDRDADAVAQHIEDVRCRTRAVASDTVATQGVMRAVGETTRKLADQTNLLRVASASFLSGLDAV